MRRDGQSHSDSEGRLTIPKNVRDRLGLEPGDKFSFEVEGDDAVRLEAQRRKTLGNLKGSLSSGRAYPGKEAEREAARKHVFMKAKRSPSRRREG
ncbi:MAG: AbrB/MazE/SpoVT family DNA-binding domain-containing protein [Actinomycetota bacterium]|nr:AbrB/MazE/SpoVT family DNA-binding domain-containing protein [Actinomycetota bacterium]